jgi:gamma-glutamylcyclotransferase
VNGSKGKMRGVLYFAYGSNLDEKQMRERCPGARRHARATLPGHALAFGGFSHRWGGAVASVIRKRGHEVEGLLYAIPTPEVALLDRFEGSPYAYQRVTRIVVDERANRRCVQVYMQPEEDFVRWTPAPQYFDVIQRAYLKHGFDRLALVLAIAGGPP